MNVLVFAICSLSLLVAGCASTETVKQAQGQGVSRSYPYAYDRVFDAVQAAAKAKELEVVDSDKRAGRIVLSHGVTLWSWGERIAVFVKPGTGPGTEVEIVSKPVMSPLNFPPDWPQIIFKQLDVELQGGK
jgi:hypothetical protein